MYCVLDTKLTVFFKFYFRKSPGFPCNQIIEKLGPGTKSKVQVQSRSLWPKHFTKFGLPTTHTPTQKLLGHFRGTEEASFRYATLF